MPNTPKNPGYKTCLHVCHQDVDDNRTRVPKSFRYLHMYHLSSRGELNHNKLHQCGKSQIPVCPNTVRVSNNQDYIKFGGRLAEKQVSKDNVIARFQSAWKDSGYSGEAPMINSNGTSIPRDLSLDETFPTDVPWYAAYAKYHGLAGEANATEETQEANEEDGLAGEENAPEQTQEANEEEELNFLRTHKFQTRPGVVHQLIDAIPWKDDERRLKCKFVVSFDLSLSFYSKETSAVNVVQKLEIEDYEWLAALNGRHKYIGKDKSGKQYVHNGLFNLAFEMKEHPESWDISLVPWETFRKAIMEAPHCEEWKDMVSADLVAGGPDLSNDFVALSDEFGIHGKEWFTFFNNFVSLSHRTSVWPDPAEAFRVGSKLQVQQDFQLAALSLGFSMPLSVACRDEDVLKYAKKIQEGKIKAVLKREYSDRNTFVIGPSSKQPVVEAKAALTKARHWDVVADVWGYPQWMLQPFVVHLRLLGEVRSFVVGGILACNIITTPETNGTLSICLTDRIRPLHRFQVPTPDPNIKKPDFTWFIAEDLPVTEYTNWQTSYENFVLQMMGQVIALEEHRYKVLSDLRIFVRADVSVFKNEATGEHSFFVNEFTRSTSTFLFPNSGFKVEPIISSLAIALHTVASKRAKLFEPPLPSAGH